MKKIIITAILGTTLFANMATSAAKHAVKSESKNLKHKAKKNPDLNIDKKVKKEKRKLQVKAIKAVL